MSNDIRKMIDRVDNFGSEKQYKVFESRFYYSTYKEILFVGNYNECTKFILLNPQLNLEMLPLEENKNKLSESVVSENNLAIIGSRSFNNYSYAKQHILDIIQKNQIAITKIISGGASGADKIAEIFANKFNIPIEVLKPNWEQGKQSGVIRNTEIIKKSDYVIAFWDGQSKGTLDSIKKAKAQNKKLFIVKIAPEDINEGVRQSDEGDYEFDFLKDTKEDIMTLKYNKNYITKKQSRGIVSYFTYKINKKADKDIRNNLLTYIKSDLKSKGEYEHFLNKSVVGLFNNPNIEISDVDLILIPQSSSSLNFDLANKIKNKIPNALFLKDTILKNEPENVTLNYDMLKDSKMTAETIMGLEKNIKRATVDGVFKIKKIGAQFRRYILNFLKIDDVNRKLLNKVVGGKVLVIDDFVSEGTTFREVNRLMENYAPKEIILFSLIG